MNIANIWQHPKTSVAGVLLAVVTVAGVLSGQGVTLGHAGTGTVVALIASIGTALLGLLSRDPMPQPGALGSTSRLGAWALIALTLSATMTTGCTQQRKISVAQEIVKWAPSITSAVNTVAATVAILAPIDAAPIAIATTGLDTLSAAFQKGASDYLANPNQTTLAFLQGEIVKFQQSVNTALLTTAGIKDPQSQRTATVAINSLATIVNTIFGLVQSISTKPQVATMAAQVRAMNHPVYLRQVRPYLDASAIERQRALAAHDLALNDVPSVDRFFQMEAAAGF